MLSEGATLEQVIDVVNNNSARVQSYSTTDARIDIPGMLGLRGTIAIERPWRFRLRAGTGLTGPEVDLGSNDELFWVWVRRSQPPAVHFCRHDQFALGNARHVMPVEPQWLIDALGLVSFDPGAEHRGPFPRRDGNLEIRSTRSLASGTAGPPGPRNKITVIDRHRGWVLEQHVYSATGELLAIATASEHRYDPEMGVSLPRRVAIQMPPANLSLTIDLGNFQINQLVGDPAQMWSKPTYAGYPEIDLSPSLQYFPPPVPLQGRFQSLPPENDLRLGDLRLGSRPTRY